MKLRKFLIGICAAAATFVIGLSVSLPASAFTTSISMVIGHSQVLTDNQYSEGHKTWSTSDSSIVSLGSVVTNVSQSVEARAIGSAVVTCVTKYTAVESQYDPTFNRYMPTLVNKSVTSYFRITVTDVPVQEEVKWKYTHSNNGIRISTGSRYPLYTDTDNEVLNWSSSDVSVAAVDECGNVIAKKTGTTTITASHDTLGSISIAFEIFDPEEEGYIPIRNVEELKAINGSEDNYYLANDIDLSDEASWELLNFKGTLDGQNHVISGLNGARCFIGIDPVLISVPYLTTDGDTVTFVEEKRITISNLIFSDCNFNGDGGYSSAPILTDTDTSVINCHNLGGTVKNAQYCGGICAVKSDEYADIYLL